MIVRLEQGLKEMGARNERIQVSGNPAGREHGDPENQESERRLKMGFYIFFPCALNSGLEG
jgi:hypothetical protein